ncbi:hypothetical protein TIMSHEL_51 [Mycobacterium phage Timshel]|uniref:DUF6378 domain-containing protein n=1 Tax=Mycobacterium phage Timshel TaxID=1032895 RepID=G1DB69_9CAUD|nr:phosphofructokinase [Mycobacterium phage Timshel]AEJ92382.1 hypothetical protein TIMSHEL_51 [Mycobacterium phage Timshel]
MTESILEEAQRLIHGQRNQDYGHPRDNFGHTAALFSAYLGIEVTMLDVAQLMMLVKMSRQQGTGYHRDSTTDIAGYAGCIERCYDEPREDDTIDAEVVDLDEPRQWLSLADVPAGVIVTDRLNNKDQWRISEHSGLLEIKFEDEKKWDDDTAHRGGLPLTAWDNFGPFTEVRA